MKNYYVYILTNADNNVLYIGVTNDLICRIYEHKNHLVKGFTKKYNVDKLVYYEQTTNANSAIKREKQLKNWRREWKINLVQEHNPYWRDLSEEIRESAYDGDYEREIVDPESSGSCRTATRAG